MARLWARFVFGPAVAWAAVISLPVAVVLILLDLATVAGFVILSALLAWVGAAVLAHRAMGEKV